MKLINTFLVCFSLLVLASSLRPSTNPNKIYYTVDKSQLDFEVTQGAQFALDDDILEFTGNCGFNAVRFSLDDDGETVSLSPWIKNRRTCIDDHDKQVRELISKTKYIEIVDNVITFSDQGKNELISLRKK